VLERELARDLTSDAAIRPADERNPPFLAHGRKLRRQPLLVRLGA
jgi:hypothetical protein